MNPPTFPDVARPILRAVLRDAAAGHGLAVDLRRLTSLAADVALDADLPPFVEPHAASDAALLRRPRCG